MKKQKEHVHKGKLSSKINKIDWAICRRVAKPLYENEDSMHNFYHVIRIKKKVSFLRKQYGNLDNDWLNFLIYFHGLKNWVRENTKILKKLKIKKKYISSLTRSNDDPTSPEEKVVCDANMLENVGKFGIKKAVKIAKEYNQTDKETIELAKSFQSRYKFYTPLGKKLGKEGLKIKQKWIKSLEAKI